MTCTGSHGNALAITTVTIRSAHIVWTAPVTNSDGSQLTDLAGFHLRWGPAPHDYDHSVDVMDPAATSFETTLDPGTWYFVVSAVNSTGVESAPSNEVLKTVY
jgi:hypothetical protein